MVCQLDEPELVLIPHIADFAPQKLDEASFVQIWTEAGDIACKLRGKELGLKKGDRVLLYVGPFKMDTSAERSHVIPCPLTFPTDQVLRIRFALRRRIHGI